MGKENNIYKKHAIRELSKMLIEGKGMTINEMVRKVSWEFGYTERFVMWYLNVFADVLVEEEGVYKWKSS